MYYSRTCQQLGTELQQLNHSTATQEKSKDLPTASQAEAKRATTTTTTRQRKNSRTRGGWIRSKPKMNRVRLMRNGTAQTPADQRASETTTTTHQMSWHSTSRPVSRVTPIIWPRALLKVLSPSYSFSPSSILPFFHSFILSIH